MFEKSTGEPEAVKNSRKIFQEAANAMKDANEKEERLMILESWQAFEVRHGLGRVWKYICTMLDLYNLSKKTSIYLSWDKYFLTIAKKSIFLFLEANICCGYSLERP